MLLIKLYKVQNNSSREIIYYNYNTFQTRDSEVVTPVQNVK